MKQDHDVYRVRLILLVLGLTCLYNALGGWAVTAFIMLVLALTPSRETRE